MFIGAYISVNRRENNVTECSKSCSRTPFTSVSPCMHQVWTQTYKLHEVASQCTNHLDVQTVIILIG